MYGIKNNSSGVVRMYVTTCVTQKPEVRIDLLTFIQIANNFALELFQSYFRFLTYSVIAMSAKFPCVSKRPIVLGIIDLPNFKIWKKFLEVVRVYLELHTYALRLRHFLYKFLVRMMIKKEIEKEEDTIKRPQKKSLSFFFFYYNKSLCEYENICGT